MTVRPPDAPRSAPTRLLIVDDHAIVRHGLRAMLDREPAVRVVAEAGTPAEAVQAVEECAPDIVLLTYD